MAKILLIEDDEDMCLLIEDWLSMQNHTVEFVRSGSEGQELLEAFVYDIVILDLQLPDLNGEDICKQFRAHGGKTPVLMLTGKAGIEDKEFGLDSGADDYLTKPFHMRELSARIRALIRRPVTFSDNILTIGDIALDTTRRELTKAGQHIKMFPRDLSLFEFLLRNANQVFSADALIERVWKTDTDVGPETVRSVIKRLREKLDDPGKASLIETVHKVGYRLRTETTE